MSALKQRLFDEYGFADKRYRKLSSSDLFAVDGRRPTDFAADGQLYGWFCSVFVDTTDAPAIKLRFANNIPESPQILAWVKRYAATYQGAPHQVLEVRIEPSQQHRLVELAEAFEDIVKPGRSYPVRSFKYTCPRLAAALRRLEKVLSDCWGQDVVKN
ncbi:hypothetical protein LJR143_003597 [Pseudoxanthomonas sp. LjRoot143]|uniref:hypothetical protein n=1 Tax=Pseudoxanthomonas sp. LjRoot143 TaxID=3342266 RepID=UPI003ED0F1F6